MDNAQLAKLIADLYNVVDGLDEMFADCKRRFTPDGHLIGSIGEAVARHIYDLNLEMSSKAGYDATIPSTSQTVQIRTTSTTSVSVRKAEFYADCLLVLKLDRRSGFEEIYAGLFPHYLFTDKEPDRRGYYSIAISTLQKSEVHIFKQIKSMSSLNNCFSQERRG